MAAVLAGSFGGLDGGTAGPVPATTATVQATLPPAATPAPAPAATGTGTTAATATVTPAVTPTAPTPAPTTWPGPPDFIMTTTPVRAEAARGETVTYQMEITPVNGFSAPIRLELRASALFVSQTYDLGVLEPPFPQTLSYDFTVPGTLPPGITVDGTMTATGGGITRENRVSLAVK